MSEKLRWQTWIEPIASISVVVSLLVLVAEVRTNTRALERQSRMDYVEGLTEPFFDDVPIGEVLAKIKAIDGREGTVQSLMDAYGLTEVEAAMWGRYLFRNWFGVEADFMYGGRDLVEPTIRALLPYPDATIYWETNRSFHSPEFQALVDEIIAEGVVGG